VIYTNILLLGEKAMSHRHKKSDHQHISKSREWIKSHPPSKQPPSRPRLEIVLKCESAGSLEAVAESILKVNAAEVDISIIHKGIGDINHSDILMAETGSKVIAGFQVNLESGVKSEIEETGIDVRLYDVIYKLADDIKNIAENIIHHNTEENILGTAKVIKLFKSGRKDIIAGCKVLNGSLALHQHYRIISAMGSVHSGAIESLHIEERTVHKATKGQEVGIKIRNFNKVKLGDLLETFKPGR